MKRNSNSWLAAISITIAVGLILLALGGYLNPIISLVTQPFISTQRWFSTRYTAIVQLINAPQDTEELRSQNIALENEVSRLQSQIIDLEQQLAEKQILEELLGFAQASTQNSYVGSMVIGRDPNPFLHYIIIDKGTDDGLRKDMPVITQAGLVGRVDAVIANAARVQLISDPNSVVNVTIQNQKINAQLNGSLTGEINLEMIPQDIVIQPGDVVLTSGLGGSFPANILIGQIISVRKLENDLFQSATVQPVVDFAELQAVLVINNFRPVNIAPLIPGQNQ